MVELKKHSPLITVIMSVYNDSQYLRESIESVLHQTFGDFEFLIVDDASTDNSLHIIKSYAAKDYRIVYYVNQYNKGLTKNLNFMLRMAKGKYIARMDGNDVSLANRFEKQINVLQNTGVDLVWSNAIIVDEEGQIICESSRSSVDKAVSLLERRNYIVHPSVMFNKRRILKLGGYDERLRTGQDGDLWIRLKKDGAKFYVIKESLIKFRIEMDSVTANRCNYYKYGKNYIYAKICLKNFEKKRALYYIRQVNSIKLKIKLLSKLLMGEHIVSYFLKVFPRFKDVN